MPKIIKTKELDDFNKKWHKAEIITSDVRRQARIYSSEHRHIDFSAPAPEKAITTDYNSPLIGLKMVEFNITELCNRTCHFCPRANPDIYPNQNLNMTVETVEKVINELIEHEYVGQIIFSGWGEPLLNRKILDMIKICTDAGFYTALTTNGDKILESKWYNIQDFIDVKLSEIIVDVYDDSTQFNLWYDLLKPYSGKIRYVLNPRFIQVTSEFNNRTGLIEHPLINSKKGNSEKCYMPAVKAFIDWDGSLLLCCNDWGRVGGNFGNVNEMSFSDIWNSDNMNSIRRKLMNNSRLDCGTPCDNCTTGGNQKDARYVKDSWEKYYRLRID